MTDAQRDGSSIPKGGDSDDFEGLLERQLADLRRSLLAAHERSMRGLRLGGGDPMPVPMTVPATPTPKAIQGDQSFGMGTGMLSSEDQHDMPKVLEEHHARPPNASSMMPSNERGSRPKPQMIQPSEAEAGSCPSSIDVSEHVSLGSPAALSLKRSKLKDRFLPRGGWSVGAAALKMHQVPVAFGEEGFRNFSQLMGSREDLHEPSTHKKICNGFSLVLSPSGPIAMLWNTLFVICISFELIMFPMDVFALDEGAFTKITERTLLAFWTSDFVLTFNMGILRENGLVDRNRWKIAKTYAESWMLPDIAVLLLDWALVTANDTVDFMRVGKVVRFARVVRLVRVLRLRKLISFSAQLDDLIHSPYGSALKSMLANMFAMLVLSHFLACLWFAIGKMDPGSGYSTWVKEYEVAEAPDVMYQYLLALHWAVTQFTPGGMHVQPQNMSERFFAILMLISGMVIFSTILRNIAAAAARLEEFDTSDRDMGLLRRFCRQHNISDELLQRVTKYSEVAIKSQLQRVHLEQVKAFALLPKLMFMEVMKEIYVQRIKGHIVFKALMSKFPSTTMDICTKALKELSLTRGSYLFFPGDCAHSMHFLLSGSLKCFSRSASPQPGHGFRRARAHYVQAGACFGEACLWTEWVYFNSARARSESEFIFVNTDAFQTVVVQNMVAMRLLVPYCKRFVEGLNELHKSGQLDRMDLPDTVSIQSANYGLAEDLAQLEREEAKAFEEEEEANAFEEEDNGERQTTASL